MLEEQNPTLKSQSTNSRRASFRHFVLLNQKNLHWLFTAAFLIVLGNWFGILHGQLEFAPHEVRLLIFAINVISPTLGFFVLRSPNERNFTPLIAIWAFISILFQTHVATLTCFVLLLIVWIKNSAALGIFFMAGLQVFALMFCSFTIPGYFEIVDISVNRSHAYYLRAERRNRINGFDIKYVVAEITPIGAGLQVVKKYWAEEDSGGSYKVSSFHTERSLNDPRHLWSLFERLNSEPDKLSIDVQPTDVNNFHWNIFGTGRLK